MPSGKIDKGPTARAVAQNVKEVRKHRGLQQQQLAALLADVGRPIAVTALSRLEDGERRVDVDDLMALAVALDVNPNRLLLPLDASDREIELTPAMSFPAWGIWQWATGYMPLPDSTADGDDVIDAQLEEIEDFRFHTRPPEIRRERQHPLMLATERLLYRVGRVIHQATKAPYPSRGKPDLGLETTLTLARRELGRVSDQLDAIEEQAADRG